MECVDERACRKDDALLEHSRLLGVVSVNGADKVEATHISLCQIAHFPLENPKLSDVQLAQLGHEVDIHAAAEGVGHQMTAMVLRPGGIGMPCHATDVSRAFREDGNAIGHYRALEMDVEEVSERSTRVVQVDRNQFGVRAGGRVVVAPKRNQVFREIHHEAVSPI